MMDLSVMNVLSSWFIIMKCTVNETCEDGGNCEREAVQFYRCTPTKDNEKVLIRSDLPIGPHYNGFCKLCGDGIVKNNKNWVYTKMSSEEEAVYRVQRS